MKRYLLISPWCPYPEYKNGGVHTLYHLVKNKPFDIVIDLIYFLDEDKEAESALKGIFDNIEYIPIEYKRNILTRLYALAFGIPDLVSNINFKKMPLKISKDKYDVIVLDQVLALGLASKIKGNSFVISMLHDNIPMFYERKARIQKALIAKIYSYFQKKYLIQYEKRYFTYVDRIIYVSPIDAEEAKKAHESNSSKITFMQIGVIPPKNEDIVKNKKPNSIVFSGVMDYGPNEDAACFLITDIYPKLKKLYPDFKLCILGKNPTNKIIELAKGNDDIIITGFVENMVKIMTSYLLYVSPLRYGSGMKNKILEAMIVGMPVILSEVSSEGIVGLKDGENCYFVKDNKWAEKIFEVLNDASLRNKVAANGKRYIEMNYDWKKSFVKFLIEE